jgi:hypothetical protein
MRKTEKTSNMKDQQINEFSELLHNVMWVKTSLNKPFVKQLENLILTKKQFDFSKDELIDWYVSNLHFPKPTKIDSYIFNFLSYCYDAVTFQITDHSTILILREKLSKLKKAI